MALFRRRARRRRDRACAHPRAPVQHRRLDAVGHPLGRQARRQPAAPGPARARDAAARRRRPGRHPLHVRAGGHPARAGRRARPRPVGLRGVAGPAGGALAGVRPAHPGHREAPRPAAHPTLLGRRRPRSEPAGPGRPTSGCCARFMPTAVYPACRPRSRSGSSCSTTSPGSSSRACATPSRRQRHAAAFYADYAALRRYLVDEGFLSPTEDGQLLAVPAGTDRRS